MIRHAPHHHAHCGEVRPKMMDPLVLQWHSEVWQQVGMNVPLELPFEFMLAPELLPLEGHFQARESRVLLENLSIWQLPSAPQLPSSAKYS